MMWLRTVQCAGCRAESTHARCRAKSQGRGGAVVGAQVSHVPAPLYCPRTTIQYTQYNTNSAIMAARSDLTHTHRKRNKLRQRSILAAEQF